MLTSVTESEITWHTLRKSFTNTVMYSQFNVSTVNMMDMKLTQFENIS